MNAWGVLVGAGEGKRFGGTVRKPYVNLLGRPLAWYSLSALMAHADIRGVVWVIHPEDWSRVHEVVAAWRRKPILVVTGGKRRQDSVLMGLRMLPKNAEWAVIQDAARPLLTPELLTAVLRGAKRAGAAILALPVADTAKRQNNRGRILKTVPRQGLWLAHTPQVFRVRDLKRAYERLGHQDVTDDALLLERMKKPVALVPSAPWNMKVTTRDDLPVVEALLRRRSRLVRRGR